MEKQETHKFLLISSGTRTSDIFRVGVGGLQHGRLLVPLSHQSLRSNSFVWYFLQV